MAETDRHLASRRAERRRRLITGGLSGAVHAALLIALITIRPPDTTRPAELDPIPVVLAPVPPEPPPPPDPEPPAEKPKPAPPKKAPPTPKKEPLPPKRVVARVKPAPPTVVPVPAAETAAYGFTEATEAQVAGAATAESGGGGGGGGGCNMTRRLQAALRKDRQAQAAMAEAHRGRPIMMWNGDWVRHPSQEGAGLAAVREAILWEVGFAPEACKNEPQRGMVLISMNDGPGAARLVVGSGSWRWQDLLFTRGRGQTLRR